MSNLPQQETNALLALVRAGLWGCDVTDLSPFPLSAEQWNSVLRLALQQTVVGVAYDGLCRLPDTLLPPETTLIKWVAETDSIERRNMAMNKALRLLMQLFADNAIVTVVLKGQGVASFYERPLLRECGDIDLFFPVDGDNAKAKDLIEAMGINTSVEPDGSMAYRWHGFTVEHHCRLFDLVSPTNAKRVVEFQRQYGFSAVQIQADSLFKVSVPSPMLNLLMLNTHIMKHAFGWGIGLRQLCDMARAYHCLHTSVDSDALREAVSQLGVGRWTAMLHSFLVGQLGLDAASLPYREAMPPVQSLSNIVWRSGNFGFNNGARRDTTVSVVTRKRRTAMALLRNARFALAYAPKEGLAYFLQLAKGQLK